MFSQHFFVFSFINIGIVILIVCLVIFLAQAYKTYLMPFTVYGEADMSYLDNELLASLSAGDLTHFHSGPMAFEQEAPNLPWTDPEDKNGDGISVRPNYVWDLDRGGKIRGHFSWKTNVFGVRQQSAAAAYNDMGPGL